MGYDIRKRSVVRLTIIWRILYDNLMDGFEKFDLTTNDENTKPQKSNSHNGETMKRKKINFLGKNWEKKALIILGIIIIFIVFIIFGIVFPALRLVRQAKIAYSQAKIVADAAKRQNVAETSDQLNKTKQAVLKTQADLHAMGYLAFIPLINAYYNDGDHLIKAALDGLDGGRVLVDSVAPYADVLGLKGKGSFVGGSAEQRIQTAVTTLGKITPNIDKISKSVVAARNELDNVDPNHYPSLFGGDKIKNQLAQIRKVADEADVFVTQASPLIKVLPALLGEPDQKKYLVLFQNDKELRPSGGFMTAYAIMRLEHGVIHADSSDDIYSLDATIPNKPSPPKPIQMYLPKVPDFNLRDTNLSPDFVESMKTFNQMYIKAGGYKKVDGIIAIDTYPLVDAMNILGGEVTVDGTTLTTKTNKICNCADVIYQLEAYADQPVGYVRSNRKGLIGDLMISIMNKAFSSSPKLYWGPLFQTMINDSSQKHILYYVYSDNAQKGIEALNAAGRIQPFDGDYLHINEANFGGAKSNLFVTESVDQSYEIKSDGTIVKTVTVNYKNPFPPSDCNLEHGNLCLNAILPYWVRFYVPKGSQLIKSQTKMTSYDELGKTVFDGFLTVRPLGIATFTVSYELPFKLSNGSPLPALYQKQPGTNGNQYTVSVNGKQREQFFLSTDKTLKITP